MILGLSLLLSAAMTGTTPAVPKAPPVVTVRAKEFSYSAPTSIKSGATTFRLLNDGKELHHLTIIRLGKGKTMADLTSAMKTPGPMPAWTTEVGGPNPALPGGMGNWVDKSLMKGPPPGKPIGGMAALAKGRSATFSVDLKAGHYGLICFYPDAKDGKSHFAHGMSQEFTVAAK